MKLKIETQLNEAKKYVKESMNYVYFTVALFIISGFVGYAQRENLSVIENMIRELISQTFGLNVGEMIFFILQNNLLSSFIAILSGVAFGIPPIMFSMVNGTVIGYVLGLSIDVLGTTQWWRLLPHGIFELPAIFISMGLGIKLGFSLFSRKKPSQFKKRFYSSINVFLMIVTPLLILAAIIEGLLIFLF